MALQSPENVITRAKEERKGKKKNIQGFTVNQCKPFSEYYQ